jgi:hypothetical protein
MTLNTENHDVTAGMRELTDEELGAVYGGSTPQLYVYSSTPQLFKYTSTPQLFSFSSTPQL